MSETTRIVRIPRTDERNERLLLHITQTSLRPLHLNLIATEHEHLYHAELKQSNISSLKSSQFAGKDEELQHILASSLLHVKTEEKHNENLELVASVADDSAKINVRRNIGGIIQLVATITLDLDDEREEVSPFSWVDEAVGEIEDGRQTISELETSLSKTQNENAKLKAQLEELMQAKKEHDEELFQKFAALLNTKKQKIRELTGISPAASGSARHINSNTGNSNRKRGAMTDDDDDDVNEDEELEDAEAVEEDEHMNDEHEQHTEESEAEAEEQPPPTRELPIKQKNGNSQSSATMQAESMEHDDDTEDEL